MEKWGLTLQSCFKILFLPSLYIIIPATFTWRCPDKVRPVPDPGGGGEDSEADHQGHQPAGLGHSAPGLGQGRVTHEDVALHRQSWEQEMRWKPREEAVEYTTINLEIISNGSFKWILLGEESLIQQSGVNREKAAIVVGKLSSNIHYSGLSLDECC